MRCIRLTMVSMTVHACTLHVNLCMIFDCGRVGPMLLFKLLTAWYASCVLPACMLTPLFMYDPLRIFLNDYGNCPMHVHYILAPSYIARCRVMHVKVMTQIIIEIRNIRLTGSKCFNVCTRMMLKRVRSRVLLHHPSAPH